MAAMLERFDSATQDELEQIVAATPSIENYGLRARNRAFAKSKVKAALKAASGSAVLPEIYQEEYDALIAYQAKLDEYDALGKEIKQVQKALDDLVLEKYASLTEDEIKYLLFERKWMPRLHDDINGEIDRILSDFASRAVLIAKRYEHTLGEIEAKTAQSKDAVRQALERMGFKW